jgi:glutathione peroxidase
MSIYDFSVNTIDGAKKTLIDYKGQVMLIVNVASECGFTSQYEGLEELYKKFSQKGLVVLGFPCNQFGGQEPGDDSQIKEFCQTRFGVAFPMFSKIEVNGSNADPLFVYLKSHQKGILGSEAIKWNFTKFLVDRNGEILRRYAPQVSPAAIEKDIVPLL